MAAFEDQVYFLMISRAFLRLRATFIKNKGNHFKDSPFSPIAFSLSVIMTNFLFSRFRFLMVEHTFYFSHIFNFAEITFTIKIKNQPPGNRDQDQVIFYFITEFLNFFARTP